MLHRLLCFLNEMSYVRGSLCYKLINGLILSFVVSLIVSVRVKMTGDGDFLLIDSWTLIIWWSYIDLNFTANILYAVCFLFEQHKSVLQTVLNIYKL